MWPYWLLFAVPSVAALAQVRVASDLRRAAWLVCALMLVLMIGLRHEVGGDWLPYEELYDAAQDYYLSDMLSITDPAYGLLTWAASRLDLSIYSVNLVCAAVFVAGIVAFCRQQPNPALGVAVAVPMMVILLAMGYTRQATAMGFELLALAALHRKQRVHFFALVLMGTLFHRSALVLVPLVILSERKNPVRVLFWALVIGIVAAAGHSFLSDYYTLLWGNYVVEQKESEGALLRVLVNVLPAVVVLVFRKRLFTPDEEARLWVSIALVSVACLPLVMLASTATDRLALYLSPLQIVVMTRLPRLFAGNLMRSVIVATVIVAYGMFQFVWLNFALNAESWVPYRSVFFSA